MAISVVPAHNLRAAAREDPAYMQQKSNISAKIGQSSTQLKLSIRCLMSFWLRGVTLDQSHCVRNIGHSESPWRKKTYLDRKSM